MPEYTVAAAVVAVLIVASERFYFRSGLFRDRRYWIAMAIVVFFQSIVDGLLTRRPDPIVSYNESFITGIRFPFAIPIEDWLFGFSLVTLALLTWRKAKPTPPDF